MEFLEYLNAHPSENDILAAVHMKPEYRSRLQREYQGRRQDEKEFSGEFGASVPIMGVMPSPLDDEFRSSLEYASQLKEKMKIN